MSAFVINAVRFVNVGGVGTGKRAVIEALGPTSYDAAGSIIDLSSANTVLTGLNNEAAFTVVRGVAKLGVSPAASDRYSPSYIPAASGAPATGLVKLRDQNAASDAEPSGDLSGTTFIFEVIGT